MKLSLLPRRRAALNEAVAATARALVETLERRALISGSPPEITDARSARGDAPYSAAVLAHFDDADISAGDTHTAKINWGDGSAPQAVEVQQLGQPTVFAEHTYPAAGTWTATLTVTDAAGSSDQQTVLMSPSAPFAGPLPPPESSASVAADNELLASPDGADSLAESSSISQAGPPTVTGVYVNGANWTQAFRDHIAGLSQGSKTLGWRMPGGADQLLALPWVNADMISITFSEDVSVSQGALSLRGVEAAQYAFAATGGFSYGLADVDGDGTAETPTATWTLAAALPRDRVIADLDQSVSDSSGESLDGEWAAGADAFPSGNGTAGGDFRFHLNILPGDANGDGRVESGDHALFAANFGTSPRGPRQGDFNGDAYVNSTDFSIMAGNFGKWLPVTPLAPTDLAAAPAAARIELTWTDNSTNETGFRVERSTDAGFTQNLASFEVAAGETAFSNTGLDGSAAYHYRVFAYTDAGDSVASNPATATTPAGPPAAPTDLSAAPVSAAEIYLTWMDNSDFETGFEIDRATDAAFSQGLTTVSVPAGSGYLVSRREGGLSALTTYFFRVRATNGAHSSGYTNVASAFPRKNSCEVSAICTPS